MLPTHDQATCPTEDVLVRILSIDEADDCPGGLYDLRLVVLAVSLGHTRLYPRAELVGISEKIKTSLTMYVSPHPPSSIWCRRRNSQALLALFEVAYVSPASDKASSANIVAYVKQIPLTRKGVSRFFPT